MPMVMLPESWADDLIKKEKNVSSSEIVEKYNLTEDSKALIEHYKQQEQKICTRSTRSIGDEIKEFYRVEEAIRKYIEGLECWGEQCNCTNPQDTIKLVEICDDSDSTHYVQEYCLDCGGWMYGE